MKKDLKNYLEKYFLDNPTKTVEDVLPVIEESYKAAIKKNIKPYSPVSVVVDKKIGDSYDVELKKVQRKEYQDESTMSNY